MAKKTTADNSATENQNPGNLPAVAAPSMNALPMGFQAPDTAMDNMEGWEQKGLPPIVKPALVPLGAWIQGTIVDVVESSLKTIKNPLLYLSIVDKATGNTGKIAFPVTATIAPAFGFRPGDSVDTAKVKEFVGHQILIKKIGQAPAKKGQKKGAHLFQCWLKAPAALPPKARK